MKKEPKKYASSLILEDGGVAEMVYDEIARKTLFAVWGGDSVQYSENITVFGSKFWPYPADHHLIAKKIVGFPSEAVEFESEEKLIEEVQNFIHSYLDVSPFFEKIASYYVCFTWLYDRFNELAYLRALGDYGTGKSRLLKVIGSVCYKPIFAGGATTVSPIFRIIDAFHGTLILDEADYRFSDTTVEIIKILNSGYAKGSPVLRTEGQGTYEIKSYDVYCPKIIATRKRFDDMALESRFLIEELDKKELRSDIPINLLDNFEDEVLQLRNKLLMWRFKKYHEVALHSEDMDRSLEPRLNQIVMPLLSIIRDESTRSELKGFIGRYNEELIRDRGMSLEGEVLEAYLVILETGEMSPTIKHITETLNARLEEREKVKARYTGYLIRNVLKLKPRRTNEGYVVSYLENMEKIEGLKNKFGITDIAKPDPVNEVNEMNVSEEQKLMYEKEGEVNIERFFD